MPKPLFSKLVAICAIGFFCLFFGSIYGLSNSDQILCMLSIFVALCSFIRFFLLYRQIRSKSYRTLTGICTKCIPSSLWGKTQKITIAASGKEYEFTLEKQIHLLTGHHYRLYFALPVPGMDEHIYSSQDFIGYEEIHIFISKNKY